MVNTVARSSQLDHSTVTGRASHPYGRANPTSSSTAASFFSNEGRIVASLVDSTLPNQSRAQARAEPMVSVVRGFLLPTAVFGLGHRLNRSTSLMVMIAKSRFPRACVRGWLVEPRE